MGRFRRVLEPGPDARVGRRARLAVAALGAVIVLGGGIGLAVSLTGAESSAQSAAKTRVLILGDSVTLQTAGDYTWRYRLAEHLNLSAPGAVDFVGDRIDVWDNTADKAGSNDYVDAWFDRDHHAVWGDATRTERDAVEGLLRATPADVMVVALGANDLTYLSTPQQAADDMLALINNARRVNSDIDVVVAQVLDRSDYVGGRDLQPQATAYNTVLDQQVGNWQTPTSSVVVARTYQDWDPYRDTWDGSHPNPAGEYVIARGVANALAQLGIGATFGPLYGDLPWPGTGRAVTVDGQPGQFALTWAATPGATAYLVERRVLSRGEQEFQRQPGSLPAKPGTNTWTTDTLPAGTIAEYRIVPVKGTMTGQPGPPGRATTR
ncbi:GDSL family lipase [Frankia sp. CcI49]|uniref:GDSL-type esterase/lipase family protein n=1 Tax=unclassified Frankia TaxID=2632575 RepID=UPI0006CA37A6|nr:MULTISPECIES: GDSL-type esterase/lipase family protein [unclassified Frankia]KPM52406.1 hydrolase GDSL [Frankia sp. R43]ONH59883.1 GDSL family lipase [Frankia sp. CcI49]